MTPTPRLFSLAAAFAALACSCGPRAPDYDYSKEPNPRKSEYVIGIADALEIAVWKKPELSAETTVRPDGTITMPLIGDLTAVGRTPSQLKQEIQRRISEYFKDDDSTTITVKVAEVNSYKFTVSGEVEQPGIHTSKAYVTVAEAIALAGGFTRFAKRDEVTLMRRNQAGAIRRIPIVYSLIANGEYPEMNLYILSGDSIFVP